jgi:hypothetical protein
MPTKREEDEALAAHRAAGSGNADPGWYPDPGYPSRDWQWNGSRWTGRHRKRWTPKPGWYPDPEVESREWHWDGSRWSGRHRERVKRNNFSSAYNLLPMWAQVALPIVAIIAIFGLLAAGEDQSDSHHPGGNPVEREELELERQLELEHLSMGRAGLEPATKGL